MKVVSGVFAGSRDKTGVSSNLIIEVGVLIYDVHGDRGRGMRRNGFVICAVIAAVAFALLARNADSRRGGGRAAAVGAGSPTAGAPSNGTGSSGHQPGNGGAGSPGAAGNVDPDSFFTPTRLRPGQRPPQFVIVSFDGAGSHAKWEFWRRVAAEAHMRFTAFLSGIYLVGAEHKTAYVGPGHAPGRASINWFDTAEVRQLIDDLNIAWRSGYEIGTHYNGHFCAGAGYAGNQWTTADWINELNQFFRFLREYRQINADPTMPALTVPAKSVQGGRTPCLEGRPGQLMPALRQLGMSYDSSGNRNGLAWPRKNQWGIWEFPMAYVPLAGGYPASGGVISMDYNFWVKQTGSPPGERNSEAGSRQVLDTYRAMFQHAYAGNRAPLVLGNHFNSWNNNAYTMALAGFLKETCRKPDVQCVPYRDVIRWMAVQDPQVLADLQAQPAVYTV